MSRPIARIPARLLPVAIAGIVIAWSIVTLVPIAKAAETPDGIAPASAIAAAPRRPPLAKLPRPGVSGIAGMPPVGGCLIVEGFSREANASGVRTNGLTGFFECSVAKRISLWAQPTHFLLKSGASGWGDIAFGPKVLLNHESARIPLIALGYSYKQPAATNRMGSGLRDHKVFLFADKIVNQTTRITANFSTKWEGWRDTYVRQYSESLAVATPIHGKLGGAFQTWYATSVLNNCGGAVVAAVYSVRPTLSVQAGVEHGFGPRSPDFGLILGANFLYRGRKPR